MISMIERVEVNDDCEFFFSCPCSSEVFSKFSLFKGVLI